MIEFKEVQKNYANKTALKKLSISFEKQKTHVLLGSSGCGKSTILRLIVGLIQPTYGEIFVNNSKLTRENQKNISESIGYVIQEGGLFPHLTALENVTLKARLLGWSEEKINSRVEELIDLVQLRSNLIQKFPQQLSGGQRQRVSLIRALFLDPPILLLDEPLGALDPIVRSELQDELKSLFSKLNKTVFMVTHDVWEAALMADGIYLFHEGELIQKGEFKEFIENSKNAFVKDFVSAQIPPKELQQYL